MSELGIGPYEKDRIVLCSGDANPKSQRKSPCAAGDFFPGGKWVGAMRNAAERLGCRFVIFAGPYGLVDQWDVIGPYDVPGHKEEERKYIMEKNSETIPRLIGGNKYDLVVLYGGANPRDVLIEVIGPILKDNRIDLITFGRPNMYDVGKIKDIVEHLIKGTTLNKLRKILSAPNRLEFFPK